MTFEATTASGTPSGEGCAKELAVSPEEEVDLGDVESRRSVNSREMAEYSSRVQQMMRTQCQLPWGGSVRAAISCIRALSGKFLRSRIAAKTVSVGRFGLVMKKRRREQQRS